MVKKIPMDKLVVDYIEGQLGSDPIVFDPKSYISLTLFSLFRKRKSNEDAVYPGKSNITVVLPGLFIKQQRTYISKEEIKVFEQIIRASFEERIIETIYERLCHKHESGKSIKYQDAVQYAHAKFGLSHEILSYQTLWKRVQRHKSMMQNVDI